MIMIIIFICYKNKFRVKNQYDCLYCFCFSYIRDFDSDYICLWSDLFIVWFIDRLVFLYNYLYGGFYVDVFFYFFVYYFLL